MASLFYYLMNCTLLFLCLFIYKILPVYIKFRAGCISVLNCIKHDDVYFYGYKQQQ